MKNENARAHRAACLRIILILLTIWFIVSFGCGILFREQLDAVSIGNAPLGFWMSQQGSIICFIGILIAYTFLLNKLDKKYRYDESDDTSSDPKSK